MHSSDLDSRPLQRGGATIGRETIPVAGPWITERELAYVAEAAATGWYANAGVFNERFESALASAVGRRHAISLPSCTSGLHLALLAAGVGPGDEVVVPDCTWIATAAPIEYVGATPVFADIDPVTWCLSAESLRAVITPRTRAVIAVDLYGSMPAMSEMVDICARHGLLLIEDAAEAIGSTWHGRPAGSFGAASVFSFHGSKTVTTGEGGMVVTDDSALHQRMLVLRDHGRAPGDVAFYNQEIGYKYRMSALQAALGLAQVERLEELVARKRQIFAWYAARLGNVEGLTLNAEPPDTRNSYWMVTMLLDPAYGLGKEEVIRHLESQGIASRPFFHPLSSLPAYRGTRAAAQGHDRNGVSYRLSPFGINLPSALCLDEQDVDRVCTEVRRLLAPKAELQPGDDVRSISGFDPDPTGVMVVKYRLVLLGAANPETRRMLLDARDHQNLVPYAFIDNDPAKWTLEFCGLPVVGGIASIEAINAPDVRCVNLITRDTRTRYLTTHEMVERGCRFTNFIHSAIDLTDVTIGTGNYLQAGVTVQAGAVIGDNVSFHVGSIIAHEAQVGSSVFIAHGVCVSGCVEIGDGVFIGANATLLPRIRIGAWATVGAGAVVISDVPDGATVVGNPARVVRAAPVPFTGHETLPR